MSTEIHHPHDGFFKASMSNLSVAQDLLKAHLAPELVQQIDWSSLRMTNKSYIDEQLSQFHSDMVYTCQLNGQDAYIYTLIEHQTNPERLLPFRLLEYRVRLFRDYINQGHKDLPLVVELVLYSGKQTPYPYSVEIYDCFEVPDKARELMFKPLQLIDLGQLSEQELSTHGSADMLELLLKQGRERTFLNWLKGHSARAVVLFERDYWKSALIYILDQEKKYGGDELVEELKSIYPLKEEAIMQAVRTIRQESRILGKEEGMRQGMQQGMQQGILEIAKNMLMAHLEMNIIQRVTGLSKEKLEQVQKELGL